MIRPIRSNQVLEIWPDVVEHLRSVPMEGYDLEDILAKLVRAEAQLWVAGDPPMGVVVTELDRHPKALVCFMWLCGGESMVKWIKPMEETIRGWAVENGCTAVEIVGRPGWERLLGYTKTHSCMRLELSSETKTKTTSS